MTNAGWRSPITVAATGTYRKDPAQNQDAHLVLDVSTTASAPWSWRTGIGSWNGQGKPLVRRAPPPADAAGNVAPGRGRRLRRCTRGGPRPRPKPSEEDRAGTTLLVVSTPDPEHILTGHIGNGALIQATLIPGAETRSAPETTVRQPCTG